MQIANAVTHTEYAARALAYVPHRQTYGDPHLTAEAIGCFLLEELDAILLIHRLE